MAAVHQRHGQTDRQTDGETTYSSNTRAMHVHCTVKLLYHTVLQESLKCVKMGETKFKR